MAGLFALAWAAACACGPSFQAIYEGNARFEHCYALEENPRTTMRAKADCWRDWSEHYTYGQTRDRVEYAVARYVALSRLRSAPTDEAMMNAAPGMRPRVTTITAPAPTNAFAPPPKILVELGDAQAPRSLVTGLAPREAASVSVASPTPGAVCADRCLKTFRTCGLSCEGAGSSSAGAPCNACDGSYRTCMRACFK
ncbi:MAG: hypothetical protein FWD73_04690 [Polyangiaceae bacterium]|nr:hypothetical protein [Polyangiaceae bacterium]